VCFILGYDPTLSFAFVVDEMTLGSSEDLTESYIVESEGPGSLASLGLDANISVASRGLVLGIPHTAGMWIEYG
jgi:hypothetical protein